MKRLVGLIAPYWPSLAGGLLCLALVTLVHSPLLDHVVPGINLSKQLIDGVASQRILWNMIQPGAFGAFLLVSVLMFLRGRPYLAVMFPVRDRRGVEGNYCRQTVSRRNNA